MAKAAGRKGKGYKTDRRAYVSGKAPPSTISGLEVYRVDNGSLICRQCEEGDKYHKGHHPTCPKSRSYGGRLRARPKKSGATVFTDAEKMTLINKPRHANVIRFVKGLEFQARKRAAQTAQLAKVANVTVPADFKFQPPSLWEYYSYQMRVDYYRMKMAEAQAKAHPATAVAAAALPPPLGTYHLIYFYDFIWCAIYLYVLYHAFMSCSPHLCLVISLLSAYSPIPYKYCWSVGAESVPYHPGRQWPWLSVCLASYREQSSDGGRQSHSHRRFFETFIGNRQGARGSSLEACRFPHAEAQGRRQ